MARINLLPWREAERKRRQREFASAALAALAVAGLLALGVHLQMEAFIAGQQARNQYLQAQIAAVGPRVLVGLGRVAVQTLLRDPTPISRQRGRWREYEGVKLMPTFHPAYLLRNPAEKRHAWEDLQLVLRELGRTAPAR